MTADYSALEAERQVGRSYRWHLLALLCIALVTRLVWVLILDPDPRLDGGDSLFYLDLGNQVARGNGLRWRGNPTSVVGPVYPAYLASLQLLVGPERVVLAARIGQALLGSLMVWIIFAVGMRWRNPVVGLVAAALLAVDLRFIVETGAIYTETIFAVALLASMWVYIIALEQRRTRWWLLVGILLGLLSLTRAVAQLLPLVLVLHLGVARHGRGTVRPWRTVLRAGLLIIAGAMLVMAPWMFRNWIYFGHPWVSEGGAAHLWLGATGDGEWTDNEQMLEDVRPIYQGEDRGSTRYGYLGSALQAVLSDPLRYVGLRLRRMLDAYVQPSGTVVLGDVWGDTGLKSAAWAWLTGAGSFRDLVSVPAFWPKVAIYVMHYGSLALTLLYVVSHWRAWRKWVLLALVIGYFSGVYAVLTIIPRYLFPIMPLYLLLASAGLVDCGLWIVDRRLRLAAHGLQIDLRPRFRNPETEIRDP